MFDRKSYQVKGKLNRLKIGQKVRAKKRLVDWFSSHLVWSYGRPVSRDPAYSENEKEIRVEELSKIHAWSGAKLSGKMPMGVVSHYGAADIDSIGNERKNVYIVFEFKTTFGFITEGTYVKEKDLVAVRKTKSQKR